MERNRLLFSLFGITTLAGVLLGGTGCTPTIRAVPEDVIESEAVRVAREEGREQGRREGSRLCKEELDERLRDFVRRYRDELLYLELTKGGAIVPAQVRLIYNPARISRTAAATRRRPYLEDRVAPPVCLDESGRVGSAGTGPISAISW